MSDAPPATPTKVSSDTESGDEVPTNTTIIIDSPETKRRRREMLGVHDGVDKRSLINDVVDKGPDEIVDGDSGASPKRDLGTEQLDADATQKGPVDELSHGPREGGSNVVTAVPSKFSDEPMVDSTTHASTGSAAPMVDSTNAATGSAGPTVDSTTVASTNAATGIAGPTVDSTTVASTNDATGSAGPPVASTTVASTNDATGSAGPPVASTRRAFAGDSTMVPRPKPSSWPPVLHPPGGAGPRRPLHPPAGPRRPLHPPAGPRPPVHPPSAAAVGSGSTTNPKLIPTNDFEMRVRIQRDKKNQRDKERKQRRAQEKAAAGRR